MTDAENTPNEPTSTTIEGDVETVNVSPDQRQPAPQRADLGETPSQDSGETPAPKG